MARLLVWLIRLYQSVSRRLPRVCRFCPSCSEYTVQALQTHGVLRGLALGCWRILRCNPLCQGGHDPVPPRGGRPPAEVPTRPEENGTIR